MNKTGSSDATISNLTNKSSGTFTASEGTLNFTETNSLVGGLSVGPLNEKTVNVTVADSSSFANTGAVIIGCSNTEGGNETSTLSVFGTGNNSGSLAINRLAEFVVEPGGQWTQSGVMTLTAQGGKTSNLTVESGATFIYGANSPIAVTPSNASIYGISTVDINGLFKTGQGFFDANTENTLTSRGYLKLAGTLQATSDIAQLIIPGASASTSVQLELTGNAIMDTQTYTVGITANTGNESGNKGIYGTGSLEKRGIGTLALYSENSYSGKTTVSEGTLELHGANAIASSSGVEVTADATLSAKANQTLNDISGGGTITGDTDAVVAFNNSDERNFTGSIDVDSFQKIGTGTLRLAKTDSNTLSGDAVVNVGRLDILGELTGDLNVNTDGIFSPGNSVGTATVQDAVFDGGLLLIEMDDSGMDLLSVKSILFSNEAQITIQDLGGGDLDTPVAFIESNTALPDLDWNSLLSPASSVNWTLSVNGNQVLAQTASPVPPVGVPEPATWVLFFLGACGLACLRKKGR